MTWARPELAWLLLLVPAVLLVGVWAERRRRRDLALLAAIEKQAALVGASVVRARTAQVALAVLATLALVVAALGPRLGFEWQQQSVEGVSIVVVLDVSRSMDARDVSPSRMEVARREVTDLVGLLRGDAVGLVVFAAGPYVRIPLTIDYDTFLWALQDSSSDTIRAQGSSLAGALSAATGLLEKASGSGKAIVLVSDGEGHDSSAALDTALEAVRAADVRVYALGVGDPSGAPIPLASGGFKKDLAGNVVVSRLDEAALKRVAAATGGAYVRAVASDEDVRALYVGEIRGKLDAAERGVRREKLWHERYQWPLAVGLLAMVGSALLGVGRGRRRRGANTAAGAAAALLLTVGAIWAPPAHAGAREDGLRALAAQEWSRAAELLGQARVEDPGDVTLSRALGEALYRAGRYREAEQLFRTLATTDPDNRAVHLHNAGNAAYRGGRLADAARAFREAAAADPNLVAAQKNATAVEKEIAARTSPPPPEDPNQGEQGGESGDQQGEASNQGSQGGEASGEDGQASGGEDPSSGGEQAGEQGSGQQQGEEPGDRAAGEQQPSGGQASGDGGERQSGDEGPPTGAPTDDDGGRRDGVASPDGSEPGEPGADGPVTSIAGESGGEGTEGDAVAGGTGTMTREQAAKLVDAIPDGRPRVVVGGDGTEKDW